MRAFTSALVVASVSAPAFGQLLTMTGQSRSISGECHGVTDAGFVQDGPRSVSAPGPGVWSGELHVNASMAADGWQASRVTADEVRVDDYRMFVAGGGGPGWDGYGTMENRCIIDFRVHQRVDFFMQGELSIGPWMHADFELSGPGFFAHRSAEPAGRPISFSSVSGTLEPGVHRFSLIMGGEASYVGPGGNGTGGSPNAAIVLHASPAACLADFNADGFVDFFDYDDFVNCFENGVCPGRSADVNRDGFVDFFDYDFYVGLFEAGC